MMCVTRWFGRGTTPTRRGDEATTRTHRRSREQPRRQVRVERVVDAAHRGGGGGRIRGGVPGRRRRATAATALLGATAAFEGDLIVEPAEPADGDHDPEHEQRDLRHTVERSGAA